MLTFQQYVSCQHKVILKLVHYIGLLLLFLMGTYVLLGRGR